MIDKRFFGISLALLSFIILTSSITPSYAQSEPDFVSTPEAVILDLIDGNGFLWDINGNLVPGLNFDPPEGTQPTVCIVDGNNDAFDCAYFLRVGGTSYNSIPPDATEDGGREVVTDTVIMNNLQVNRKIFVPTDDAFARFLEILVNPTGSNIAVQVEIDSELGSNGGTLIISSSSGDTILDASDDYFTSDDGSDGGEDPSLAHVFSCDGASVEPTNIEQNFQNQATELDQIRYTFNVNVPANGRVIIMHFSSQNEDRVTAAASAQSLLSLQGSALSGLSSDEMSDIVNFDCSFRSVGGEILPIDTIALLLGGTQTNAVWIMSILTVIGSIAFGALYITTRNPNNMRNIKVILRDYLDR